MGSIVGLIIFLLFITFICATIIILQVRLSKKENMWPGLIMPIISFGFSLIILMGFVVFVSTPETTVVSDRIYFDTTEALESDLQQHLAEREEITRINHLVDYGTIGSSATVARVIVALPLLNIPTIILLLIYAACRGKRRKQRSLDLMNVQDL
jgi:hypothetical protein